MWNLGSRQSHAITFLFICDNLEVLEAEGQGWSQHWMRVMALVHIFDQLLDVLLCNAAHLSWMRDEIEVLRPVTIIWINEWIVLWSGCRW